MNVESQEFHKYNSRNVGDLKKYTNITSQQLITRKGNRTEMTKTIKITKI